MPPEKNNITILIAPLDWGLGHATRCVPIIRVLLKNSCTVLIATSGHHQKLLQKEFPEVQFLHLPGYGITYGKVNILLRLVLQLPRFYRNIKSEHIWLQKAIRNYGIDIVISDNRYGLHTSKVPCIFMTHQLQVQAPALFKWTERGVRNRLYRFIQKFDVCWVPDVPGQQNSLGGTLSHPAAMPALPVTYLGWLTRFLPQPVPEKKYKLVISLSGPEPQRTVLENLLLPQLKQVAGSVLLVRGLPGQNVGAGLAPALVNSNATPDLLGTATSKAPDSWERVSPALMSSEAMPADKLIAASNATSSWTEVNPAPTKYNVTIVNHLPGTELQQAIAQSQFFVSRCGYSTLMDLQAVACRCIFVPTPGQTEQEYLGKLIAVTGKAVVLNQKNIDLQNAISKVALLPHFSDGSYANTELEKILLDWLKTIGQSLMAFLCNLRCFTIIDY